MFIPLEISRKIKKAQRLEKELAANYVIIEKGYREGRREEVRYLRLHNFDLRDAIHELKLELKEFAIKNNF